MAEPEIIKFKMLFYPQIIKFKMEFYPRIMKSYGFAGRKGKQRKSYSRSFAAW